MNRRQQVGFSQRIQLDWLEQTATLYLAGNSREQIQDVLQVTLQDQLSVGGTAKRGNREKAITILLNIWITVPEDLMGLRDDGLRLLQQLPVQDHFPLHWGMTMAAYPFFGAVAETVGRLLQLQGTVTAAQAQRRLREQFGERATVARAARRILRSFIDWGALQDTDQRGVYQATPLKPIEEPALAAWIIEATLITSGAQAKPLQAIVRSPALFPFTIRLPSPTQLGHHHRLELFRQGLDVDMVTLR